MIPGMLSVPRSTNSLDSDYSIYPYDFKFYEFLPSAVENGETYFFMDVELPEDLCSVKEVLVLEYPVPCQYAALSE